MQVKSSANKFVSLIHFSLPVQIYFSTGICILANTYPHIANLFLIIITIIGGGASLILL